MGLENNLVIVSGASGGIGREFFQHYLAEGVRLIGISRKVPINSYSAQLDLLDQGQVRDYVRDLNLRGIRNITYIHSIGISKYEPDGKPQVDVDGDGIDDEVFASNVTTFANLAQPLFEKTRNLSIKVHVIAIGSISDLFKVPLWQSYSGAKDELRRRFRQSPSHVKATMVNVSSVNTDLERYGRPFADTRYWLEPNDLVARAIPIIESQDEKYLEVDIFNEDPNFPPDYFTNIPNLKKAWEKNMGYANKVGHGGKRI